MPRTSMSPEQRAIIVREIGEEDGERLIARIDANVERLGRDRAFGHDFEVKVDQLRARLASEANLALGALELFTRHFAAAGPYPADPNINPAAVMAYLSQAAAHLASALEARDGAGALLLADDEEHRRCH